MGAGLLVDLIVARKAPEIMAGLVGLWRHCVEHHALDALGTVSFGRTGARGGDADLDADRGRRFKVNDLPAIDMFVLTQLTGPERRRIYVAHPAGDGGGCVCVGGLERGFSDSAVSDG